MSEEPLFRETVEDLGSHYRINIVFGSAAPTVQSLQAFYDYFGLIRQLDKNFVFNLDLRQAALLQFVPFVPKIYEQASIVGRPKCIGAFVRTAVPAPCVAMVNEVVRLFSGLTPVQICA